MIVHTEVVRADPVVQERVAKPFRIGEERAEQLERAGAIRRRLDGDAFDRLHGTALVLLQANNVVHYSTPAAEKQA